MPDMANNPQITDWILYNAKSLKLDVTRLTLTTEWLPGYFDYHSEIQIDEVVYSGRGIDRDEELAFIKSVAEALERAACRSLNEPWGTSAHVSLREAKRHSYYERVTLDRALCHHFCRQPLHSESLAIVSSRIDCYTLIQHLKKHNLALEIFQMRPVIDAKSVMAIAYPLEANKFGFISGFGTSPSLAEASMQAIKECLRDVLAVFVAHEKPAKQLKELREARDPLYHHWFNALHPEALAYFNTYLRPEIAENVLRKEAISITDMTFEQLDSLAQYFSGIPFVFLKANTDKLLVPQFGSFLNTKKTQKRFNEFCVDGIVADTSMPHSHG